MNPSELGILVATLGGAAVGLERQWSGHAEGPSARFAGFRTFTLLGGLAGVTGWLWASGNVTLAAILLAGGVALTVVAYAASSRRDVEATTEVAALIVLAAGVLAGGGMLRLASGIIAIEVLILLEKSRLHSLVRRIDDTGLRAGVRFAVMALVVLPLLPETVDRAGLFRPRLLWLQVLFFCGLSFVGYLLSRMVGSQRGYLLGGVMGGLISSTNVTFTYARSSRSAPADAHALALGAVGANAVLYLRVLTATAVLNAGLVPVLAPYLAAPALIAALVAAAGAWRSAGEKGGAAEPPRNPLQLPAALQMAALFQVVLLLINVVRRHWGESGLLTAAAVLGLTDVDALTLSMAREVAPAVSVQVAAVGLAVGILANTLLKMGVAMVLGAPKFRFIVAGTLLLMAIAAGASILFLRSLALGSS